MEGSFVTFCELAASFRVLLELVVLVGLLRTRWMERVGRDTILGDERLLCNGAAAPIKALRQLLKTLTHLGFPALCNWEATLPVPIRHHKHKVVIIPNHHGSWLWGVGGASSISHSKEFLKSFIT